MVGSFIENPVRVVDVFVQHLDLGKLEFNRSEPAIIGRPSCDPSILLKLYTSTVSQSNPAVVWRKKPSDIELMWLLGRLTPDFKTISRFRKENGKTIRKVYSQFVLLWDELTGLLVKWDREGGANERAYFLEGLTDC